MALAKPFSFEERKEIERLCKQELTFNEIARLINRSKHGVISEIKKNCEHRRDYCAKTAHARVEIAKQDKLEKLRKNVSSKQVELIKRYHAENWGLHAISQQVGLGRRVVERVLKELDLQVNPISPRTLQDEIEVLNQQIILLSELIKEVYGKQN